MRGMPEELVMKLSDAKFKETLGSNPVMVVDCYADWCGPCKILAPVVDQLALEFRGKIRFGKLNTDDCPATAQAFGIMSIPTLLFFKNGKLQDKIVGVVPKGEIEKRLLNVLKA